MSKSTYLKALVYDLSTVEGLKFVLIQHKIILNAHACELFTLAKTTQELFETPNDVVDIKLLKEAIYKAFELEERVVGTLYADMMEEALRLSSRSLKI